MDLMLPLATSSHHNNTKETFFFPGQHIIDFFFFSFLIKHNVLKMNLRLALEGNLIHEEDSYCKNESFSLRRNAAQKRY